MFFSEQCAVSKITTHVWSAVVQPWHRPTSVYANNLLPCRWYLIRNYSKSVQTSSVTGFLYFEMQCISVPQIHIVHLLQLIQIYQFYFMITLIKVYILRLTTSFRRIKSVVFSSVCIRCSCIVNNVNGLQRSELV